MTKTYESIFICPGDLPQDKLEAVLEKVKSVITRADGKIVTAELWGKRKLSYPIEHHREGSYAYLIFTSPTTCPALLDRHYQVTDQIVRGLTVEVDPRNLEKIRPTVRPIAPEGQEAVAAGAPAAKPEVPSPDAVASSPQTGPA